MNSISIRKVDSEVVIKSMRETGELCLDNIFSPCLCFEITDGESVAHAMVLEADCELVELARFQVPFKFRGHGFGKRAARSIAVFLVDEYPQVIIDPINGSEEFWEVVFEELSTFCWLDRNSDPKVIVERKK